MAPYGVGNGMDAMNPELYTNSFKCSTAHPMVEVGGIEPPSETGLRTNFYTLIGLLDICIVSAQCRKARDAQRTDLISKSEPFALSSVADYNDTACFVRRSAKGGDSLLVKLRTQARERLQFFLF